MQTLLQDLRYGARILAQKPGFTVIAVLTLALGIGANSAIFSIVNAVLLRPLPFADPERLVRIWETFPAGYGTASLPNLKDWREQNSVFTQIAAYQANNFSLQGGDYPERISGVMVLADFFDVLGVPPQLGRSFRAGEDEPGKNRLVILSHALWQRRFGADPTMVGQSILLGGEKYEVVGVMPPQFRFPSRSTELWVPLDIPPTWPVHRGNHFLDPIARLKPGVTLEQAREQMKVIARRLEQQYPDYQTGYGVRLVPLQEEMVQNVRQTLWVMFGAVGFVLLIACVNVANLLLARATGRRREIAIRSALGAGRGRLVRQFLTESILLSIIGGGLGLLLAKWGVSALLFLASAFLPRASEVSLDGRVVGFTLLLSLLTGIVFGLAPALQSSKADLQAALKEGGNAGTSPQSSWLRSILVVAEISTALVLLVGAGLLIKSFVQLQRTNAGLKADKVLTMNLTLPDTKYTTSAAVSNFYQQLLERVAALPGVQSSAVINRLPLQDSGTNGDLAFEGDAPYPPGRAPHAEFRMISPDYFRTLGIPLLAGRFFNERDQASSNEVAIINQALAKRYLPNQDPIGKRILRDGQPLITIVGVVGDVRQATLTQPPYPEIYFPHTQPGRGSKQSMSLVVRTMGDSSAMVAAVRQEVRSLDPQQPLYNIKTMETVIDESVSSQRLNMILLGIFAAVALILAMIGIYSVMSYTVTQSTRELGIRMALGAQSRDVLKLVVGRGLVLTVAGVGLGLVAASALTGLMRSLLFNVSATDPLTFALVAALLAVVALAACYVPARRATKVDPMVALRYE